MDCAGTVLGQVMKLDLRVIEFSTFHFVSISSITIENDEIWSYFGNPNRTIFENNIY